MLCLAAVPSAAHAAPPGRPASVPALDRMMVALAPESARDARRIREAYRQHLQLLVLDEYAELEGALLNGGLAPLPPDPLRFNLRPRLEGPSPIGEKDLAHQESYIAARPSTIGCLLDVASRVTSGPVEVTSLVRHTEYQDALRATNRNATTSVPMHTMGLAFDIALVNTPIETVYEIRDVLRRMRDAGEILFIGERRQLVFHVVPHPSRLGHFMNVYARVFGGAPSDGAPHVVAFSPRAAGAGTPSVSAEVVAVLPSEEFADQWWAAHHAHGDVMVEVSPRRDGGAAESAAPDSAAAALASAALTPRIVMLVAALLGVGWPFAARRPKTPPLSLRPPTAS